MNKIVLESRSFAVADYRSYIELRGLVAFYGYPNKNGDVLPVESAEACAQTLVNMPVDAKYKVIHGKADLGGHEQRQDGSFGTENVGTHTSVALERADVEVDGKRLNLLCLYATSRIWKRNKNVCSAVLRLFSENALQTSYVISFNKNDVTEEDGHSVMHNYVFESNTLLGSENSPAQDCAGVLSLAAALSMDIEERSEKMLTTRDILDKLYQLVAEKTGTEDFYISYVFPESHIILVAKEGQTDLEYLKFSYSVSEDVVSIGDSEAISLQVPAHEMSQAFAARDGRIAELMEESAGFRATAEALQQEKAQAETEKTKLRLAALAADCRYFSKDDLASGPIATAVAACNEADVHRLIAERAAAKGREETPPPMRMSMGAEIDVNDDPRNVLGTFTQAMRQNQKG